MRIKIAHETRYRYEYPVRSIIQMLRMTPRDNAGQHVLSWRIEPGIDGRLRMEEDSLGNIVQVFSADGPVEELSIRVTGEVETTDMAGVVSATLERVPDLYYLRDTPLTEADEAIRGMAEDVAGSSDGPLATLHRLLSTIHGTMIFDVSPTDVGTTAIEAFRLKRGVCQDLTHVFIAAARHLDIPARYVSGYFLRNDGVVDQDAGHAWAEAKVPELGWVGFDPTNGISRVDTARGQTQS
jgi:transglutaminase-like putative cysteine protease